MTNENRDERKEQKEQQKRDAVGRSLDRPNILEHWRIVASV
jgi:hypothetical protein